MRQEIQDSLEMKDPEIYELPSRRKNIYVDVVIQELLPDPIRHMSDFLGEKLQAGDSAIIYVPTKTAAQRV